MNTKEIVKNRKAFFHYSVIDSLEAGIALLGTEVKSLRASKVNISDAFCLFRNGRLYVYQLKIEPYDFGSYTNHKPLREKSLLLHKREMVRLQGKLVNQALSLIPLRLYWKKNWVKIELGVCKRKKVRDKEHLEKLKDQSMKASFEEKYTAR